MTTQACQIPTNFRRGKGDYWWTCLLTLREAIANAISYRNVNAEARAWWLEHNGGTYLVFGHNGVPFSNAAEIQDKGCTPLQSGQQLHSLNGAGLGFSAAMLRTESELIIASRVSSTNKWHASRCYPNRKSNTWDVERSNEWIDIIGSKLSARSLERFTVFYIFRLEEERWRGSSAPLNEKHLTLLPFICPSYIGDGEGHRWSPPNSLKFHCGMNILRGKEVFKWSESGHSRRKTATLAEYLERYCGEEFRLKIEPFEFELDPVEKMQVRIHASLKARAFPTLKKKDAQWLISIRDAQQGEFGKGSGSAPGQEPPRNVMMTLTAAKQNGDPKFARFGDNVVWATNGTAEFMNACGFQYAKSSKFPTLHFDIHAIEKKQGKNWVPISGMEFSNKLEREADFTLRDPIVREILLRATDYIVDNDDYKLAKLLFEDMFPIDPEGLVDMIMEDNSVPKDHVKRFEIYDLNTGETLDRSCESGSYFNVVMIAFDKRTLGHRSVRVSDITIPASQTDSFTVENADKLSATERNNVKLIASELKFSEKLHPLRIDVNYREARHDKDSDWESISTKDDYVIGSVNCRPRRKLSVMLGDYELSLATVTDIPARIREQPGKPKDNKGKTLGLSLPYCDRHEDIWCEVDRGNVIWINKSKPYLRTLFTAQHPKVKSAVRSLYGYINETLIAIASACDCVQFDSYERLTPDEQAMYKHADKLDYLINRACEHFFKRDVYVKELIAKINKLKIKYELSDDDEPGALVGDESDEMNRSRV